MRLRTGYALGPASGIVWVMNSTALIERTALLLTQGHKLTRIDSAGVVIVQPLNPGFFEVRHEYMPPSDASRLYRTAQSAARAYHS